MIQMRIVGYRYGIRFERRLCEEVKMHFAYSWFCGLDLDDQIFDHSTFSVNRLGRFRDSDIWLGLPHSKIGKNMEDLDPRWRTDATKVSR
jgi:hypothetical protein